MYSTCLFCHTALGANEAVEHFPIGRRLAFDAAKGRLWVVCRKCERWNLTPVEERWEAIEECERFYRETKLRVSTEQIGLARLSEGLELVRIGKPQRPEFAAWRYGDQFGRRRRRNIVRVSAVVVGAATIPFLGTVLGVSLGALGTNASTLINLSYAVYKRTSIVARVRDNDGHLLLVRGHDPQEAVMLEPTAEEAWGLRIAHRAPADPSVPWWRYARSEARTDIRGEAAIRAAAQLLPRLNHAGASSRQLNEAVVLATEHQDPSIAFARAARLAVAERSWNDDPFHWLRTRNDFGKGATLAKIPTALRLALEMVSHEASERRALEGELYLLEDAWKEAEEIAAISDDMFLPEDITRQLAQMKKR